jgi:hypothetical protein
MLEAMALHAAPIDQRTRHVIVDFIVVSASGIVVLAQPHPKRLANAGFPCQNASRA